MNKKERMRLLKIKKKLDFYLIFNITVIRCFFGGLRWPGKGLRV